jgi:DNA-binding response OmpR family regulator
MMTRVLVADDDRKHAELVRRYLELERYEVTVVHDGVAAINTARACRPDLIVLDVMMPGRDGFDVCRELGGADGIPIVMLTGRSSENDLLLGLYLGADDYLTKPFSPRELVARVRAVLRRAGHRAAADEQVMTVGALSVDPARHEVRLRDQLIDVTPVEFDLLLAFVTTPGRVFTRRQLLERLHGIPDYFNVRSIDVHVMNLRRKLESDPRKPEHLVTVYGIGYKLIEAVAAALA